MDGHHKPAEVAHALGITATTLRRVAQEYETVFGDLPRDERQVRWWPPEAASRLHVAYQSLKSGRVTSLEQALRLIADGAELPTQPDALTLPPDPQTRALDLLEHQASAMRSLQAYAEAQARQLASLQSVIERQAVELAELRAEVGTALQALTPERLQLPGSGPSVDEVRVVVQEEITAALAMTPSREPPAPGPSADDLRDVVRGEVQSAVERGCGWPCTRPARP